MIGIGPSLGKHGILPHMRTGPRLARWALAALLLARPLAGVARAEEAAKDERVTIVLLVEPGQEALEARLRAELVTLGFDVSRRAPSPGEGDRPEDLDTAAKAAKAAAAIRVRASSGGVEVWIADRVTGKTVLREVVKEEGGGDPSVVALRVVELLRASLLEVDSKLPPRGDVPPPPLARRVAEDTRRPPPPSKHPDFLRLFVGGAISAGPGGMSPLGHVRLGGSVRPVDRLGVELDVLTPTAPASLSGDEGRASVTQLAVTAGLHASLLPPDAWLKLRLGAGGGLLWSRISAQAPPPYVARDADVFAAFVYARVSAGFPIIPQLRVRADVDVAVALPEIRVLFDGRLAGSWGLPVVLPTLGLEAAFGR